MTGLDLDRLGLHPIGHEALQASGSHRGPGLGAIEAVESAKALEAGQGLLLLAAKPVPSV